VIGPDRVYGVAELAEAAGMSQEVIRKRRERGTMPEPRQKLSGGWVWWGDEIEEWIAARSAVRHLQGEGERVN